MILCCIINYGNGRKGLTPHHRINLIKNHIIFYTKKKNNIGQGHLKRGLIIFKIYSIEFILHLS